MTWQHSLVAVLKKVHYFGAILSSVWFASTTCPIESDIEMGRGTQSLFYSQKIVAYSWFF